MKKTLLCMAAALAMLAPAAATAGGQASGIWIYNETDHCLWATVYTAGSIVKQGGFPNWVPAKDKRLYPVTWKGVGQAFDVRTEILSTKQCVPQNARNPLVADIRTTVQGSLAYRVAVTGKPGSFRLVRY
ncbi:MAG TPA: hypothetical protein VMF11_04035 [Candidatus Baltobacteraceae bacterium]|nr:hypothetical protein [Candidatus Baltobacteraceae bacterium]